MSSHSFPVAPLPRAGIYSLPTELEAKVVKACAEQDKQFAEWRKVAKEYGKAETESPGKAKGRYHRRVEAGKGPEARWTSSVAASRRSFRSRANSPYLPRLTSFRFSDIYADAAILKPIFRGVTFPSVTRLLLGGHYYCIDDAYGTITREAFPLLTYLDLDLRNPDAIAEWDELWVSLVDPLFSFAYLETVSISHLAEMNPSLASTLSKSCREIDVELLPLPFTESCPPFLRNTHLPEEDTRVLRQVESLETTLKDLEVQLKKAKVEEDETALSEIEKVSRPAEVKRIEREMWGKA